VKIVTVDSPDFPDGLRHLYDPPAAIYFLGDLTGCLSQPRLAVVGSRKVSAYGKHITSLLAGQAAARGVTIISGLA
jgi:DNA processing protein